MHTYLFEAKSIQSYLFSSGKLKDVISASERLDRLIDSNSSSTLHKVLQAANLKHDLLVQDSVADSDDKIHFLRCKGGAFYAYCVMEKPLQSLRSLWTLTISQMFPSMEYADALTQSDTLSDAIDLGHQQLAQSRNAPLVNLPIAKAPHARYSRSGKVATPVSKLAQRAQHHQEDEYLDLDTELHRQAYQALEMRDNAALQDRFTPDELKGRISYPIDFENQFPYMGDSQSLSRQQQDAIKDMALLHIDGNGLGLILMTLKESLQGKGAKEYSQVFRSFSDALNQATVEAAKYATHQLYMQYEAERSTTSATITLPMRPIVLGGDDITLFCRADLALDYAKTFCREFEKRSLAHLKPLFATHLKGASISPFLTASGGILFHKASHPFMHSHHLVEALCAKAKHLTKSSVASDEVGPAALAIYRVSNATQSNIEDLLAQATSFELSNGKTIQTAYSAYLVDEAKQGQGAQLNFNHLDEIVRLSNLTHAPVSMNRWRQMATELSAGDIDEAKRIFYRGLELCHTLQQKNEFKTALAACSINNNEGDWYWSEGNGSTLNSVLHDLLIIDHYSVQSSTQSVQGDLA
ncbi:hypothetical protein AB4524_00770 [Vibrio breoganii]